MARDLWWPWIAVLVTEGTQARRSRGRMVLHGPVMIFEKVQIKRDQQCPTRCTQERLQTFSMNGTSGSGSRSHVTLILT
jgi:hypothetical protein